MLAAAAAATLAGLRPPPPLPAGADPAAFSAERAAERLRDLYAGLGPHPAGSAENRLLRERVEVQLRDLGYDVQVQRRLVCRSPRATCGPVENVLARREGAPDRKAVLVSSHYDSVPAGPSVSDAGSSVAAILEVARAVRGDEERVNPIIFLINDGEEAGLMGARAFLEGHPWAREVGAVINLEARGTSGRSWMFETSTGGAWLVEAYAASVPHPATASVAYAIYKRLPTDTDLTVYKGAGLQGLGLAFIGRIQHYHTSADNLANLDEGSLQQQGETALALLRRLGSMDLESPERSEAVFFDLFGLTTIWWPAAWSLPLALATALLAGAALLTLARAGAVTGRGIAVGLGHWALTAAVALAAGVALGLLLHQIGAFRNQYPAHAWAPVGVAWAGGAAASFIVAAALRRRAGLWDLHMGGAIAWSVVAVALTLIDPALSYLALLPAGSLALAGLVAAVTRRRSARSACFLASIIPGAVVMMPILFVIFGAMGEVVLPAITLLAALLFTMAAPALAGIEGRGAWLPSAIGVDAVILLALVSALVPGATDALPERMTLGYHLDAGNGAARWVLYGKVPPPGGLVEAAGGSLRRDRALPWWDWDELLAPAPLVDLPAPRAGVPPAGTEEGAVPGEDPASGARASGARLQLQSPRGATYLELVLRAPARVRSVRYPGAGSAEVGEGASYGDWRSFRFFGVPPEGIEVVIEAGGGAAEGWIMDRTPGLPPEGAALLAARPSWAVASQMGDSTVVHETLNLPAAPAP